MERTRPGAVGPHAGTLVHEQDERDLVHLQRAIALPHLYLIEAPALAQPMLDALQARRLRAGRPRRHPPAG